MTMPNQKVTVLENILSANDQLAEKNRSLLDRYDIFSINIMASPGAGKTSLILKTLELLKGSIQIGVVEGDTASVTIDADKVMAGGASAVQINTGGNCHLDSSMVEAGLNQLPLDKLDLVIIENVGNLVCPAAFDLGTSSRVLIASVPEGDDKPYKYPGMYRGVDVLILNKVDLKPYVPFDEEYFRKGVTLLNPGVEIFPLSCKTGKGCEPWIDWIKFRLKKSA
jgi:hydrogenase nickel incorporation protein HypB